MPIPYDFETSSIVTTSENKLYLLGTQRTIFELDINGLEWKKIKLPVKRLRKGYKAYEVTKEQLKIFCGKREMKEFYDSFCYNLQLPFQEKIA